MNLNPMSWFTDAGRKGALPGSNITTREREAQGPWTTTFSQFRAREVAPHLYEALREAVPLIDAAIDRLVTLDGILRVETATDELQRHIDEWTQGVRVNDLQHGLQTFYALQSNEMYEQGLTVGDFIIDGNDVTRLRVADSKGIFFQRENGELVTWYCPPAPAPGRRDGTDQVERVLRNSYRTMANLTNYLQGAGYTRLDPASIIYASRNPEADDPYGVSIMRSTEFVARVILTIEAATEKTWSRFGDPSFDVLYKTKNRKLDAAGLETRRKQLADNLAVAMKIKRSGNSADFVNAVGADDDIVVKILGADGQVLEQEQPVRHLEEQIVAKSGLPSWMLGRHWSTAERLAQRQGELVLQDSRTRFATRKPGLTRLIATMLRARGVTWKPGDWELEQDLPNLQDLIAIAQANFLDAQAEMVRGGRGTADNPDPSAGDDTGGNQGSNTGDDDKTVIHADGRITFPVRLPKQHHHHGHKVEAYVEDSANLMRLERRTERFLLGEWSELQQATLEALGLDTIKAAKAEPVFIFDVANMQAALLQLEQDFVQALGAPDAALAINLYEAWVRGVANAAAELGDADQVEDLARATTQSALADHGYQLVKNTTARTFREDIIAALAEAAYDGQHPKDVARQIAQRFGAHEADWQRLARSEIADAQGLGKLEQYTAHGIDQYDWIPAGDACPICNEKAANGPYPVGSGPRPMTDSHPRCRCTVAAVVE